VGIDVLCTLDIKALSALVEAAETAWTALTSSERKQRRLLRTAILDARTLLTAAKKVQGVSDSLCANASIAASRNCEQLQWSSFKFALLSALLRTAAAAQPTILMFHLLINWAQYWADTQDASGLVMAAASLPLRAAVDPTNGDEHRSPQYGSSQSSRNRRGTAVVFLDDAHDEPKVLSPLEAVRLALHELLLRHNFLEREIEVIQRLWRLVTGGAFRMAPLLAVLYSTQPENGLLCRLRRGAAIVGLMWAARALHTGRGSVAKWVHHTLTQGVTCGGLATATWAPSCDGGLGISNGCEAERYIADDVFSRLDAVANRAMRVQIRGLANPVPRPKDVFTFHHTRQILTGTGRASADDSTGAATLGLALLAQCTRSSSTTTALTTVFDCCLRAPREGAVSPHAGSRAGVTFDAACASDRRRERCITDDDDTWFADKLFLARLRETGCEALALDDFAGERSGPLVDAMTAELSRDGAQLVPGLLDTTIDDLSRNVDTCAMAAVRRGLATAAATSEDEVFDAVGYWLSDGIQLLATVTGADGSGDQEYDTHSSALREALKRHAPGGACRKVDAPAGPVGIEFENVTFGFHGDPPILANVSFKIPPGARVHLRGASGCGKSTLLDLILGLRVPTSGNIFVLTCGGLAADGTRLPSRRIRLDSLRPRSWRRAVSYAGPSCPLLGGTVIEEVGSAAPLHANRLRIAGCAASCAVPSDAVDWLAPRSIETLSGGERQRVELARALMRLRRGAGLCVLDEVLSAVDGVTAEAITKVFEDTNATVISVAHGRDLLRHANVTLVIRDTTVTVT
jgi:ABC-type lipoprotein export system ATPase subunit